MFSGAKFALQCSLPSAHRPLCSFIDEGMIGGGGVLCYLKTWLIDLLVFPGRQRSMYAVDGSQAPKGVIVTPLISNFLHPDLETMWTVAAFVFKSRKRGVEGSFHRVSAQENGDLVISHELMKR